MMNKITDIYADVYNIIKLYDESDAFNLNEPAAKAFGIRKVEGNPYLILMAKAEEKADKALLFESDDMRNRIKCILDETRTFIDSDEVPGTVERWIDINPNLRFFDVAFELLEEIPDIEEKIVTGKVPFHLGVLPREGEMEKRKEYFNKQKLRLKKEGLKGTEDEIFQKELLETLRCVFRNDFPEYVKETGMCYR